MTNREWKDLLSAELGVSRTCAKEMLHTLLDMRDRNLSLKEMLNGKKRSDLCSPGHDGRDV